MKILLIVLATIGLLTVSCKSKKQTAYADAIQDSLRVANRVADSLAAIYAVDGIEYNNPLTTDNVRLKVSFYSPGNGINHNGVKMLNAFLNGYTGANPGAVIVTKKPWGREGEVDYCVSMPGLDTAQQDRFVTVLKHVLKDEDRINYTENTSCGK